MVKRLKSEELDKRIKTLVTETNSGIKTEANPKRDSEEIKHSYKSWQKSCPDCGSKNPGYSGPPNLVCESCNSPLGRIDHKPNENEQYSDVPECPTCGGTTAKYIGNKSSESDSDDSDSDDSFWSD